jgi:opacity protein-like surface antigen
MKSKSRKIWKIDLRRNEMKKLLIVLASLTVIATPAFAQSFNPSDGTGNVLPFSYPSQQDTRAIAGPKGVQAYAMARDENVNHDPYSPANTGGGSEGYNWDMAHDY